jgi:hypothetical protein
MNRFATLLVIAFCLVGCGKGTRDYELGSADFGADTLLMVEKEMGLRLPAGARGLNFYYKAPIDPAFIAKIEIPSDAKDDMAKQVSALPNKPVNSSGGLAERISWWIPTAGKVLHDREFIDDSNGQFRRAVLTDEDGICLLYLDWNT